jgi:hypothetical protein
MPTVKITTPDFNLSSYWTNNAAANMVYAVQPSWASKRVSFAYSLPSGSVIKKAQIWATLGYPFTGWSVRNVNGNGFTLTSGDERGANVSLPGTSGTLQATFNFKPNGNKIKAGTKQWSTQTYKNVYLLIDYEVKSSQPAAQPPKITGLAVPPQSVCVYDQEKGSILLFDGVTKIQHALSMKIEEEPEKHKDEYTNNARNEPDKLTLDVVMSDVYDGGGAITNARSFTSTEQTAFDKTKASLIARDKTEPFTRSENALYVLHDLKESRRKLSVITPHFIHTDMIIASITVNQDEEHTDGWEGQIVFQHTYKAAAPKKTSSTPKKTTTTPPSSSTGLLSGIVSTISTGLQKVGSFLFGKKK